jgi:hypothetical protein
MRAKDILFLVVTTAFAAVPPAGWIWFVDAMNDEEWGPYASTASYIKVLAVAGFASLLAWVAAAPRPGQAESHGRLINCGAIAVLAVTLSFCLWNGWAFEWRTFPPP